MQITPSAHLIAALSSLNGAGGASGPARTIQTASPGTINPVPPISTPQPRQIIPQISPQVIQPTQPSGQSRNSNLGRLLDIRV